RRFAEYLSLGEAPDATAENQPPAPVPAPDRWVPPDEELLPRSLSEVESGAPARSPGAGTAVVAGTVRAPHRWEQILVDASVIGGRPRWERRLAGWREELNLRLAE